MEEWRADIERGDFSSAIEKLKGAARDTPEARLIAHLNLGMVYRLQGEYSRSLDEFREALSTGVDTGRVHSETGRLYEHMGRFEDALREYRAAVEKGYAHLDVHKDMGRVACLRGDHALARQALGAALRLQPENPDLHFELAVALGKSGCLEASAGEFDEALRRYPQDGLFARNRALNEKEFYQKKTVLGSKPRCLWITITSRCNLRCVMCSVWRRSWDLPEKTVREIKGYLPYLEELRWQGGEVFLAERFEELFDEAVKNPHVRQNINTNGLLIDERWAKKLARRNVNLAYAIDGVTAPTYEKIRRGARFDELVKGLELMNAYKTRYNARAPFNGRMTTMMSFIVMKSNCREVSRTVEFARKYGFDSLQVYPINGSLEPENIFIHDDREALRDIGGAMREVSRKAKEYGIELLAKLPPLPGTQESQEKKEERGGGQQPLPGKEVPAPRENAPAPRKETVLCPVFSGGACRLPWQHLFIDGSGGVRPSCECDHEIGNVESDTLEDIWNSETMRQYREKLLAGSAQELCGRVINRENARFELIKTEFAKGNYRETIPKLYDFISRNADHQEAHLLLARSFAAQKEYAHAAEVFRKALLGLPRNGEVHFDLGVCLRMLGEYDGAMEEFKTAEALGFDGFRCLMEAAQSHFDRGEHEAALAGFSAALARNPSDAEAKIKTACVYRARERYDEAAALLKALVQADKASCAFRGELEETLREKEEYEAYREKLRRFQSGEKQDGMALFDFARLCFTRGQYRQAAAVLQQALAAGCDDWQVHLVRAKTHRALGEPGIALDAVRRALEQAPGEKSARFEAALVRRDRGETASAAALLDALLAERGAGPEVLFERGKMHAARNEDERALEIFRALTETGFDCAEVRVEAGKAYRRLGDEAAARREFHKALSMDFSCTPAHLELGKTEYRV
ncbi:MAG: tetratricopeptide repeat protein [Endomicrobiales bacterium]